MSKIRYDIEKRRGFIRGQQRWFWVARAKGRYATRAEANSAARARNRAEGL